MRRGLVGDSGSISPATVNIDHARGVVKKQPRENSRFFQRRCATTVIARAGNPIALREEIAWRKFAG